MNGPSIAAGDDTPYRPAGVIHVASGREWRGGQHQVALLAEGQFRRAIPVTVVTGRHGALAGRLREAGVPVLTPPWTLGIDPRVIPALRQAATPGAILHAHDSHAHVLAARAARRGDVTLVVTRRVAFPIRHPDRYRRADAVIAISNAVRHELLAAGCDPRRVHVVPSAVEPVTEAPLTDAAPDRSPLVVCLAALAVEKGLDTLLDAAALLRESQPAARWLVVGEGPERRALERRRADLALESTVEFAGAGSTAAALRRATVAVQPSRSEGLGSAVLQALAHGVPVVASDAGGLPDALAHGGGVLVRPDRPDELAAAVGQLLDHADQRARLGEAGRTASAFFSVDRLVERTLDVYRMAARTRTSP